MFKIWKHLKFRKSKNNNIYYYPSKSQKLPKSSKENRSVWMTDDCIQNLFSNN